MSLAGPDAAGSDSVHTAAGRPIKAGQSTRVSLRMSRAETKSAEQLEMIGAIFVPAFIGPLLVALRKGEHTWLVRSQFRPTRRQPTRRQPTRRQPNLAIRTAASGPIAPCKVSTACSIHMSGMRCSPGASIYVARAEVRSRLTRSRRRRRLPIGRHQRKRLRLRLRVKHTISHRARYKQAL